MITAGRGTTISNDGATILNLLDIVHPAAKTLVDIAKAQVRNKKKREREYFKIIGFRILIKNREWMREREKNIKYNNNEIFFFI